MCSFDEKVRTERKIYIHNLTQHIAQITTQQRPTTPTINTNPHSNPHNFPYTFHLHPS